MAKISDIPSQHLSTLNANWVRNRDRKGSYYNIIEYTNRKVTALRRYLAVPFVTGGKTLEIWAKYFYRETLILETGFLNWIDLFGNNYLEKAGYDEIMKWIAGLPTPDPEPEPEPGVDPIDEGNGIIDNQLRHIKEWIKQAILAGLTFLEEPLRIIKDIIGKVGNAISTFASTMASSIETIIAKVTGWFETIVGKLKGVIDEVWNNIQLIWETIKDVYDTIKTAIVAAFKTSWEFIKQTFTTLWDKMKDGLKWIADGIVSGIKFLWEKIKDGLNWAGSVLKSAYNALKDVMTAVWERTKQRLTDTIDSIKTGFGDAIDRLKDFFLWLWEKITAIFDKVFDMSEEVIEKMGYRVLTVQKRILERFIQAEGKV